MQCSSCFTLFAQDICPLDLKRILVVIEAFGLVVSKHVVTVFRQLVYSRQNDFIDSVHDLHPQRELPDWALVLVLWVSASQNCEVLVCVWDLAIGSCIICTYSHLGVDRK